MAKRVLLQLADGLYDLDEGHRRLELSKPDINQLFTFKHSVTQRTKELLFPHTSET